MTCDLCRTNFLKLNNKAHLINDHQETKKHVIYTIIEIQVTCKNIYTQFELIVFVYYIIVFRLQKRYLFFVSNLISKKAIMIDVKLRKLINNKRSILNSTPN